MDGNLTMSDTLKLSIDFIRPIDMMNKQQGVHKALDNETLYELGKLI